MENLETQVYKLMLQAIKGKYRSLADKICRYDKSLELLDVVHDAYCYFLEHGALDRFLALEKEGLPLYRWVYRCCLYYLLYTFRTKKYQSNLLHATSIDDKIENNVEYLIPYTYTPFDELCDAIDAALETKQLAAVESIINNSEILRELYSGKTRKTVAEERGVSRQAIHHHVCRAKQKFLSGVPEEKKCNKCNQTLPVSEFYVYKKKLKSGEIRNYLRDCCKKCFNKMCENNRQKRRLKEEN